MNTFFQIAVKFAFLAILFNIGFSFIQGIGAFPLAESDSIGINDVDNSNVLSKLTGLSDGMEDIWALFLVAGAAASIFLSWVTHSIVPVGIYIFSEVFWTSWIHTQNILTLGSYIPSDFILFFTVGMIFLFIAAVIGMLTGSG